MNDRSICSEALNGEHWMLETKGVPFPLNLLFGLLLGGGMIPSSKTMVTCAYCGHLREQQA